MAIKFTTSVASLINYPVVYSHRSLWFGHVPWFPQNTTKKTTVYYLFEGTSNWTPVA